MSRRKASGGTRSPFATGAVSDVTFTIGAETGGNTRVITCQFKGYNGKNVSSRVPVAMYLSDDAAGATPVATAPSGAVTTVTHGTILDYSTAKKIFQVIPSAAGRADIQIVEAGAKNLYMNFIMPDGTLKTSAVIAFA